MQFIMYYYVKWIKGGEKSKSQLIILDRGFDPVSPFLHELTYQTMVYDTIDIKNDTYKYETETGDGQSKQKEICLDENEELWVEFRHQHVVATSQ